jgi:hypothetical protein
MDRFQILKGKKPRQPHKKSEVEKVTTPEKPSGDLLAEAFLLSTKMMEWFHSFNQQVIQRRNLEIGRFSTTRELFRKEFCTFRFGMPRGAGNTTLALMILQHYPNSIFITATQDILNHIRRQALNFEDRRSYSIRQNDSIFLNLSADAVVVDMASYIDPRQLEKIFFINSEAFFLIG